MRENTASISGVTTTRRGVSGEGQGAKISAKSLMNVYRDHSFFWSQVEAHRKENGYFSIIWFQSWVGVEYANTFLQDM